MSLTEEDFDECLAFFAQPLPKILSICTDSLHNLGQSNSIAHQIERVSLFLELVGTECIKEVILIQSSNHQNQNVDSLEDAHLKE